MSQVLLKGSPIEVSGEMPKVGSTAPAIQGVDGDFKERTLSEFQGIKKVVCFVPSLDTSVCSTSAKTFNEKVKAKGKIAVIYC